MATQEVLLTGHVGPARVTDGAHGIPFRQGNQGELIVGEVGPKYYEQTMRGNAFVYSSASAGAVLNVLGVNSAPALWNPAGSGKNLVITKVALGLNATGTTAAGHIVYATVPNAGSQIATAAPVVSLTAVAGANLLLGAGAASVMRFAPTTITFIAAPTFLCTAGMGQATAATTATPAFTFVDDVDGRIVVPPGVVFVVAASAAIASTYSIAIYGLELPQAVIL